MTAFKALETSSRHRKVLNDPSVSVSLEGTTLYLRLDSSDVIVSASYEGPVDVWMESLCMLLQDMSLAEARSASISHWEMIWGDDLDFQDRRLEVSDRIFFRPLELLHSALDIYRGREFLYQEESPILCRCFGVRERDVIAFLNTSEDPTLEALSRETKAGMGCRSCVPQLRQLLKIPLEKNSRIYKNRPVAQWIEEIDSALKLFPTAGTWKMQIESMKGTVVTIGFDFETSQEVIEETGKKLQGFLAGAVDPELSFFLLRSRQR